MNSLGYSGTPLTKKLGLKEGFSVYLKNPPNGYWNFFETLPKGMVEIKEPEQGSLDFIHAFCTMQEELEAQAKPCKSFLKKNGMLWVSWPKGSSKIPTDLKRDLIREHILNIGLVDVKVTAFNKDWSGLKFVYRIENR